MYMYHTYSIGEYIKEYVDNMNHYIQWVMYEPLIEKNEWFVRNLMCGFFVASKVFIYTSIQCNEMSHIKSQTDKASMYFVEFYKEFGIYPGLFEFTNFDTSMFILDKTMVNENGMIESVTNDTRRIYESITIVSKIYESYLKSIARGCLGGSSSSTATDPHFGDSDETSPDTECNSPVVSDIVANINLKILPVMREIIKYSIACNDDDDVIKYIKSIRIEK